MSSNTANGYAVPKHAVYSGSKAAINSFVRIMALDCGDKKITVNAVAPGGTVTDMFYAVAKHYIPNSDNFSDEQLKEVSTLAYRTDLGSAD
jgi:tetrahydroxynaphthalene reductase